MTASRRTKKIRVPYNMPITAVRITGNVEPDNNGHGGKGDVGQVVAFVDDDEGPFPGKPFGVTFEGSPGVFWFSNDEFEEMK